MDFARRFTYGVISLSSGRGPLFVLGTTAVLIFALMAGASYRAIERLRLIEKEGQLLLTGMDKTTSLRQKQQEALREMQEADPRYLEKEIEGYIPLQHEIDILGTLLAEPNLAKCATWTKRQGFLIGKENRFKFTEEKKGKSKSFQEIELMQAHPVQVGLEDFEQLLIRIEGRGAGAYLPPNGRPDLTILQGQLSATGQEGLYELQLKILKREEVK